jgi:hypothetical protein
MSAEIWSIVALASLVDCAVSVQVLHTTVLSLSGHSKTQFIFIILYTFINLLKPSGNFTYHQV